MKKKIIIAGGTGFIGNALEEHFVKSGDQVQILTRKPSAANHIYWDGKTLGNWVNDLDGADVLINLCGKSVDCRYTQKNKKAILHSRIDPTNLLNHALQTIDNPPIIWLNASSATIYLASWDNVMTEANGIVGDDFSMAVCKEWEHAFYNLTLPNTRKVSLRMSIVLGQNEGALPKYKQITKLGLGGCQGNGKQLVSWVHIEDVCSSISFLIDNKHITGPVNITSPHIVENRTFMFSLRQHLGMSWGLPQPKLLLDLGAFFLRTETELLMKSRNVYPEKLLDNGFQFKYSDLDSAFKHLFKTDKMVRFVTNF